MSADHDAGSSERPRFSPWIGMGRSVSLARDHFPFVSGKAVDVWQAAQLKEQLVWTFRYGQVVLDGL
jgi:hypothetical protein